MRKRLSAILLMLAAVSLVAAGCGDDEEETTATTTAPTATGTTGAAAGGGGGGTTEVSMIEYAFDPSDLSVAEGDSLEVVNDGELPHALAVEGEDLATEDLDPGASEDLTVDIPAGDYEFICPIADHAEQGMTGTLTVE